MQVGNFGFGDSGSGSGGGGTIGGGGTLNYVAKFTPDGSTINNSLLFDNGTSVGLGTNTPDASALLDLNSTTQGLASPRMTTLQRDAIVAPVVSLLIFNTSSGFYNYWDGVAWIQIDTSTGGDVSGSGTTNYAVKWTDGTNSVIGDGTWAFSGNDYYPVTTGSNIGDATHRIGTIFMASIFDYSNNLTFFNGTSTTMTLTTSGQLGIGITPIIADTKLEIKVATDQRLLFRNVTYATIGAALTVQAINDIGNNVVNVVNLGLDWYHASRNNLFSNADNFIVPTAKVHIIGNNTFTDLFALKVDNLVLSPLLYVRNDGVVSIGNTTTSDLGKLSFGNYFISGTPTGANISSHIKLYQGGGEYFGLGVSSSALNIEAGSGSINFYNSGSKNNIIDISGRFYSYKSIGAASNSANDLIKIVNLSGVDILNIGYGSEVSIQSSNTLPLTLNALGNNVGIGTTTPIAKTHILGIDATTKAALRLEPIADVTEDTTGNTIGTTDATVNVTAQTISIPRNKVVSLESTIVYRKTAGVGVGIIGDGTLIKLNSSVKNVGGVLTLDIVQNTYSGIINSIAGVSANYIVSGTNILVAVTGVLDDDITWNVITKINTVA